MFLKGAKELRRREDGNTTTRETSCPTILAISDSSIREAGLRIRSREKDTISTRRGRLKECKKGS